MNTLQSTKVINAIPPTAIKDDAAFVSSVIDTSGLAYGEFHALVGAIDAAPSVLKVMGSEVKTDATTLGGTPTAVHDVTTKPGADDDNKVWVIGLDFQKLPTTPRYIQLQATAGNGAAGTFLAASFVATSSGNVSSDALDRGVAIAEYAIAV